MDYAKYFMLKRFISKPLGLEKQTMIELDL